jgi:hypothetical protein
MELKDFDSIRGKLRERLKKEEKHLIQTKMFLNEQRSAIKNGYSDSDESQLAKVEKNDRRKKGTLDNIESELNKLLMTLKHEKQNRHQQIYETKYTVPIEAPRTRMDTFHDEAVLSEHRAWLKRFATKHRQII